MFKFKSIRTALLSIILPLAMLGMIAISIISYSYSKSIINNEIAEKMNFQMQYITENIEKRLLKHEQLASSLTKAIESSIATADETTYVSIIQKFVTTNEDTFGCGIWFEPYRFDPEQKYFGPYAYKDGILYYKDENIERYRLYEEYMRRNMINRITGTTDGGELYYYNKIFIPEDSKLYFLIKTDEIEYFKPVFNIMSDMGIGGDKSIGVNNFKVEFAQEFSYEKSMKENILLSKYIPNYEEIDWENSLFTISTGAYRVESRDEFFGEDIIKDEIIYLSEGSTIILKENKDIYGRMPVVKEIGKKKVRNNGLAFFL